MLQPRFYTSLVNLIPTYSSDSRYVKRIKASIPSEHQQLGSLFGVESFHKSASFDLPEQALIHEGFWVGAFSFGVVFLDETEHGFDAAQRRIGHRFVIFHAQKLYGSFQITFLFRTDAEFFLDDVHALLLVLFNVGQPFEKTLEESPHLVAVSLDVVAGRADHRVQIEDVCVLLMEFWYQFKPTFSQYTDCLIFSKQ